jgi:hypothetical protein
MRIDFDLWNQFVWVQTGVASSSLSRWQVAQFKQVDQIHLTDNQQFYIVLLLELLELECLHGWRLQSVVQLNNNWTYQAMFQINTLKGYLLGIVGAIHHTVYHRNDIVKTYQIKSYVYIIVFFNHDIYIYKCLIYSIHIINTLYIRLCQAFKGLSRGSPQHIASLPIPIPTIPYSLDPCAISRAQPVRTTCGWPLSLCTSLAWKKRNTVGGLQHRPFKKGQGKIKLLSIHLSDLI